MSTAPWAAAAIRRPSWRGWTAGGRLIALDRDEDALEAGQPEAWHGWQQGRPGRLCTAISPIWPAFCRNWIYRVDGILADLGVSSWQLDQAERGFGYSQDGPARHADGPQARADRSRRGQFIQ